MWDGERAVNKKLDDLLDVKFIVIGESVVSLDFFGLEPLQNVGVISAAFVFRDGVIQFRAGGGFKSRFVLVEECIEILWDVFGVFPTCRLA